MPRKNNSFERALVDAEKRLAQALNERSQAQEALNDLAKEIPNLQRTVAALESQLNTSEAAAAQAQQEHIKVPLHNMPHTPEDIALLSRPSNPNITEDDTLPEPEGTPLTPED